MAQWFCSGISELHTYSIGGGFASHRWQNISVEIYQEPNGMYVVWLSPSERGGVSWLSSSLGIPRHCCTREKGALGSMVQQWRGKVKAQL